MSLLARLASVVVLMLALTSCRGTPDTRPTPTPIPTPPLGWSPPVSVTPASSPGFTATGLRLAGNAAGAALAVWEQRGANTTRVLAVAYEPGSGWRAPEVLATGAAAAAWPHVAVDPAGSGWAVWLQADGARQSVVARRFVGGTLWEAPQVVSGGDDARDADLAVDALGGAQAVWVTGGAAARGARYRAGFGWGAPVWLSGPESRGTLHMPRVVLAPDGSGVVAWDQDAPTVSRRRQVWGCDRAAGTAWGTPDALSGTYAFLSSLDLAAGAEGEVTVAWTPNFPAEGAVNVRRFVSGIGWFDRARLGSRAVTARVAALPQAQALAAWSALNLDSGGFDLWASHFRRSDQWSAPVRLLESARQDWQFALGAGAGGQAFALWNEWSAAEGGWRLWARPWNADWGPGARITPVETTPACSDPPRTGDHEPRVSVDAAGNALAVWLRVACDGVTLSASRYRAH